MESGEGGSRVDSAPGLAAPEAWPHGRRPRTGDGRSRLRRWFGVAVAALAKLKLLLIVGSALLSVAVYSLAFGWPLAAGFVAILAIHELGHVAAMRRKGFPASAPYFIPLLGAVIFAKRTPRDAAEDAFIGAGGPITGTLASWLSLGLYALTRHPVFAVLAMLGFFIHLFNLVPVTPLDGGRILSFLRWWAWIPAFAGLVFVFTYQGAGHFALPVDPVDYIILFGVLATLQGEWRRERRLQGNPGRRHGGAAGPGPAPGWNPDPEGGEDRWAADPGAEAPEPAAPSTLSPVVSPWVAAPGDAAVAPVGLANAPTALPLLTRVVCALTWCALAAASGSGLWLALRAAPAGLHFVL
jgi:Zn-dependent protease